MTTKRSKLFDFQGILGASAVMRSVYEEIQTAIHHKHIFLITGEANTGKQICVQAIIHYMQSENNTQLMECEHMSDILKHLDQITDTAFKTIILCHDLIGEDLMLIDREYLLKKNAVIIYTVDHKAALDDLPTGQGISTIHMPTLYQRQKDIIDIGLYYLHLYTREYQKEFTTFSPQVERCFLTYDWPENLKELRDIIHALVRQYDGRIVTLDMLPDHVACKMDDSISDYVSDTVLLPLHEVEKNAIQGVLRYTDGDVTQAAAILQVSPSTLYRKIKAWDGD